MKQTYFCHPKKKCYFFKTNFLIFFTSLLVLQSNFSFAQWTRRADALRKRSECPSVLYNGRIYIFGGFGEFPNFEPASEVYDPAQNKWTLRASFPSGKAVSHQGVVLVDDKIWHIGGRSTNTSGPVTSQVIIYDIPNNRWINGPQLKDPATGKALPLGGGGAALIGRTLHVFGGFAPTICVDQSKYHLTLDVDKWKANPSGTTWENTSAPMPIPRNHLSTVVLGGKIYAIGGQFKHDCGATEQSYVHAYNPVTNTWTRMTNLPAPRSHAEMGTFPIDGKIYVVGGQGPSDAAQNTVFVLNPSGNNGLGSWSNATQYKLPNYYFGISGKVVGNKFIISHGALRNVSDERRETYTASFSRNTPYKLGFVASCFSKTVGSNQKLVIKNLLFTIEGQKQYSLSSTAGWLKVTKNATGLALPSGVAMEATIDASGLAKGNYSATITARGTGSGTTYASASFCVNLTVDGGSTSDQRVVSYTLMNADTDKDIQTINNGATLNLASLPTKNLNIRANTSPSLVGSVKLVLTGAQSQSKTENSAPYALFSENGGNYSAWTPVVGSYTLQATPYSGASGSGTAGTSLTVNFKVANSNASQQLTFGKASGSVAEQNNVVENRSGLKLKVYPNPSVGDKVQINLESQTSYETISLIMYDAAGRIVHSRTLQTDANAMTTTHLLTRGINKGIYLIKVQGKSGSKQTKVIVE